MSLFVQSLGNSQKEYEKCILSFSIKNQLRYRGNLVSSVCKDDRRYYKDLLGYSKEKLMLFPYHLSDVVVQGLRVTPFQYYVSVMEGIMEQERSYDSLPNFTAADCKVTSMLWTVRMSARDALLCIRMSSNTYSGSDRHLLTKVSDFGSSTQVTLGVFARLIWYRCL
uniref:FAM91 N-terminal domain-containing protein n=1 Tax=Timema tahoe TaxID=61484 RepID=A0A7R9FM55_9NEOP|nr:unnamed protein product [Timema tahoe]